MNEKQKKLISLFTEIMPDESSPDTSVKGLNLFRIDNSFPRTPYAYNSEIIILGQGEKRVFLGNKVYTYDSSHYLVLPVPLPAECEGRIESGRPILGMSVSVDPLEIGEILMDMNTGRKETLPLPKGIYAAPMNDTLLDAAIRLLQAITDPEDKKILAPMIKKEIIYRVLQGEKGEILQALVHNSRRFFRIVKILKKIHESYSSDFNMEELAEELEMSSSTFHSSFKTVTDTSPLQYIKNVRLHKARTFMIRDGMNAGIAALQVGYESVSQFSREYKRLFGVTPAKDAAILRGQNTG